MATFSTEEIDFIKSRGNEVSVLYYLRNNLIMFYDIYLTYVCVCYIERNIVLKKNYYINVNDLTKFNITFFHICKKFYTVYSFKSI